MRKELGFGSNRHGPYGPADSPNAKLDGQNPAFERMVRAAEPLHGEATHVDESHKVDSCNMSIWNYCRADCSALAV
jgi:hypothetical protein